MEAIVNIAKAFHQVSGLKCNSISSALPTSIGYKIKCFLDFIPWFRNHVVASSARLDFSFENPVSEFGASEIISSFKFRVEATGGSAF